MYPFTEENAKAWKREVTDPRSHGFLVMKPRTSGRLQSGEQREASSHEMAMPWQPPVFPEGDENRQCQFTKNFPSLCLLHSSQQQADRLGGVVESSRFAG